MRAMRNCMPEQRCDFTQEMSAMATIHAFPAFPQPHELRHDPVIARAARELREVEATPGDWIEGPEQRAQRRERLLAMLEPDAPRQAPSLARAARAVARTAWFA